MGMWFEDFETGMVVKHAVTRTLTETDNVLFTCLTMNPAQLHLDEEYASKTEFGTRIVNSIFTLGVMLGITVYETTLGTTIANLGFESVEFPSPVRVGDTIHVESEVVSTRPSRSRPEAGIVTLDHRAINQHGDVVARCRRMGLMKKRPQ